MKVRGGAFAVPDERASIDEIDVLWRRFKRQRCLDAREQLILHYAPLVTFVAGRVGASIPASVERADLVSYGVIGLIEAVERFDLSRKVKFETYAVARIRGAILDEMRALDWVPRSVRARTRQLELARSKLQADLLREPTSSELAAEIGCETEELQRRRHSSFPMSLVALEELVARGGGEEGDHVTVLDTILDETVSEPGAGVEAAETQHALLGALGALSEREYTMVWLYYFCGFTLSRIGMVFGVTESRVSQIHSKALRDLGRHAGVRACAETFGQMPLQGEGEIAGMVSTESGEIRGPRRVAERVTAPPVRRSA